MAINRTLFISPLMLMLFTVSSLVAGGIAGVSILFFSVLLFPKHGAIFLSSTLIFQRLLVIENGGNTVWFLIAMIFVLWNVKLSETKLSKSYLTLLTISLGLFLINQQSIFFFAIVKIFVLREFVKIISVQDFRISYFCSILFFVLYGSLSPDVNFFNNGDRLSIEPLTNPNVFAIDIILFLLILWSYKSFPLVVLGFLTKSRTFVVGIILLLVKKLKLKAFFIVPIAAIILFFLLPNLFDRILNPRHGDITGDRNIVWLYYVSYIADNPTTLLFGGSILELSLLSPKDQVPHNFIIEGILNYGIIGFLLLFWHLKLLSHLKMWEFMKIIWLPVIIFMSSHDLFNLSFIMIYFIYVKYKYQVSLVS